MLRFSSMIFNIGYPFEVSRLVLEDCIRVGFGWSFHEVFHDQNRLLRQSNSSGVGKRGMGEFTRDSDGRSEWWMPWFSWGRRWIWRLWLWDMLLSRTQVRGDSDDPKNYFIPIEFCSVILVMGKTNSCCYSLLTIFHWILIEIILFTSNRVHHT